MLNKSEWTQPQPGAVMSTKVSNLVNKHDAGSAARGRAPTWRWSGKY